MSPGGFDGQRALLTGNFDRHSQSSAEGQNRRRSLATSDGGCMYISSLTITARV